MTMTHFALRWKCSLSQFDRRNSIKWNFPQFFSLFYSSFQRLSFVFDFHCFVPFLLSAKFRTVAKKVAGKKGRKRTKKKKETFTLRLATLSICNNNTPDLHIYIYTCMYASIYGDPEWRRCNQFLNFACGNCWIIWLMAHIASENTYIHTYLHFHCKAVKKNRKMVDLIAMSLIPPGGLLCSKNELYAYVYVCTAVRAACQILFLQFSTSVMR